MSNLKPGSSPRAVAITIAKAETASLKRLAWAYGCARKGSDEERQLEQLLLVRARECECECGEHVDCSAWRCGRCGKEHG